MRTEAKHHDPHDYPDWLGDPEPQREPTPEERAAKLGIAKMYARASVDDFVPRDFEGGRVPDWDEPRDLRIAGLNGRGKTHLACALALKWRAKFVRAPDYVGLIRSSWNRSEGETEREILERYSDYRVLVLDDLTAGRSTENYWSILLSLLDRRIGEGRKTIVTCCELGEEVAERNGSVGSRVRGFEMVFLVGVDRRTSRED